MMTIRVRSVAWFVTGSALALVVALLVTQAWSASASPGDSDATFVPLTTCRLVDTRPAPDRVGLLDDWGPTETRPFSRPERTATARFPRTPSDCTST